MAQGNFAKVFQSKHVFHSHLQIRQVQHDRILCVASKLSCSSVEIEEEDENEGNHKTCFEFEVRIVLQAILFLCKVVWCCKRFSFTQKVSRMMIIIDHYQA